MRYLIFLLLLAACAQDLPENEEVPVVVPAENVTEVSVNAEESENVSVVDSTNNSVTSENVSDVTNDVNSENVSETRYFTTDSCREANGWPTDFGRGRECKDDEYAAGLVRGYPSEHVCCVKE